MKTKTERVSKSGLNKIEAKKFYLSLELEISSCYSELMYADSSLLSGGRSSYVRACHGNIRNHLQSLRAKIQRLNLENNTK